MSWLFDPSAWINGTTIPMILDYQHIAADLHTFGANVDAAGYGLANASFVTLVPGTLPATPAQGMLAVNAAGNLYVYWGSAWVLVSGVSYPPSGVPNSNGSAWSTSYAVGTGANDLVQLNGSGQLPAVSGVNLTGVKKITRGPIAPVSPNPGDEWISTVDSSNDVCAEWQNVGGVMQWRVF